MNPRVCVISGSRAEFGLLKNVITPLIKSNILDLQLLITGSHTSKVYGETINEIKEEGFQIDKIVDIQTDDDTPFAIAKTTSKGIERITLALKELNPDLVIILGDRYEILAAAIAAMFLNIPIGHIHGGESTEGAIDEAIRHSITKISYFHFVAAEQYRKRVIQLGENPDRVFLVGALALDSINSVNFMSKGEIESKYKIKINQKSLMITLHPVTLEREENEKMVKELLSALSNFDDLTLIFTLPNADTDRNIIASEIKVFTENNSNSYLFDSLGQIGYLSFLNIVSGVVGNSSSGILEAPNFNIGTVNIGTRQDGRLKAASIIDSSSEKNEISDAINKILSKDFNQSIVSQLNPYGEGNAGIKIVHILEQQLASKSKINLKKKFFDINI